MSRSGNDVERELRCLDGCRFSPAALLDN